jgi:hypothetical protein
VILSCAGAGLVPHNKQTVITCCGNLRCGSLWLNTRPHDSQHVAPVRGWAQYPSTNCLQLPRARSAPHGLQLRTCNHTQL